MKQGQMRGGPSPSRTRRKGESAVAGGSAAALDMIAQKRHEDTREAGPVTLATPAASLRHPHPRPSGL
jgi:hypothetical protein